MTFTLQSIQRGIQAEPARIMIYGPGGIGKSSLGANAPNPIFIQTEDGLANIDAAKFPLAKTWDEVESAMIVLYQEAHAFSTLVVDSLDWLEQIIWQEVMRRQPVTSKGKKVSDLADYGYGEGYARATGIWVDFLDKINRLRLEKNMAIIFIAHDEVKKFDDPSKGTYNYYGPKLHKFAAEKVIEFCDVVIFANHDVVMAKETTGFGQEKVKVMGSGERVLLTQEKPHANAKNRYDLPVEIHIPEGDIKWNALWSVFAQRIPFFQKFAQSAQTPTNENESK